MKEAGGVIFPQVMALRELTAKVMVVAKEAAERVTLPEAGMEVVMVLLVEEAHVMHSSDLSAAKKMGKAEAMQKAMETMMTLVEAVVMAEVVLVVDSVMQAMLAATIMAQAGAVGKAMNRAVLMMARALLGVAGQEAAVLGTWAEMIDSEAAKLVAKAIAVAAKVMMATEEGAFVVHLLEVSAATKVRVVEAMQEAMEKAVTPVEVEAVA